MNNQGNNKPITQHQKRIITIEILYQYFLEQEDKNILDQHLAALQNEISSDQIKTIQDIIWYQDELKAKINQHLKTGWSFNSLKPIERAILFLATYEILYTKTQKAIIINEAVIIAKQYCDANAYKYINGVLDKINN